MSDEKKQKIPGRFGQRLRVAREERGISRRKLAKLAGVSGGYPSNLENGEISDPGTEIASKLAGALGMTLSELLEDPSPATPDEPVRAAGAGK